MKPIIETDDGPPTAATPPAKPSSSGGWLSRILILLVLTAVAVVGFGSSLGWFGSTTQKLAHVPAPASPQNQVAGTAAADTTPTPPDSAGSAAPGNNGPQVDPPPLKALAPKTSEGMLEECRAVSEHLRSTLPNSLEAREMQARFEYEFGDMQRARTIWEGLLKVSPNFVYALRGLGDICTVNGELTEAVRYFRRAVLVDPENVNRQITLAVALVQAAELQEAKTVLESVLARQPNHVGALAELGSVALQLEEYEAARDHLEKSLTGPVQPANVAKVHFGLVTAYRRLGDMAEAKQHLEEHQKLTAVASQERQTERQDYSDTEAIGKDVSRIYVDMARVYLSGNQPAAAELLLLRSSEMDAANVDCRQALAFLSMNQGKTFDAIRWLKELAELRPEEFTFAQEIARLYLQVGQPAAAEQTLEEFADSRPDDPLVLRTLAQFYLNAQPDPEKAIQFAQQLTKVQPAAPNFALLASIHDAAGNARDAVDALESAVSMEPNNVSYAQTLAMLREKQFTAASEQQGKSPESTGDTPASDDESSSPNSEPAGQSSSDQ